VSTLPYVGDQGNVSTNVVDRGAVVHVSSKLVVLPRPPRPPRPPHPRSHEVLHHLVVSRW
jgi:hypothetical protein